VFFAKPVPILDGIKRGCTRPYNDLIEAVSLGLCRSQYLDEVGDARAGPQVGGIDTETH